MYMTVILVDIFTLSWDLFRLIGAFTHDLCYLKTKRMSDAPHIPAEHQTKLITYLQTLSDGNLSALSDNFTKAALCRYK